MAMLFKEEEHQQAMEACQNPDEWNDAWYLCGAQEPAWLYQSPDEGGDLYCEDSDGEHVISCHTTEGCEEAAAAGHAVTEEEAAPKEQVEAACCVSKGTHTINTPGYGRGFAQVRQVGDGQFPVSFQVKPPVQAAAEQRPAPLARSPQPKNSELEACIASTADSLAALQVALAKAAAKGSERDPVQQPPQPREETALMTLPNHNPGLFYLTNEPTSQGCVGFMVNGKFITMPGMLCDTGASSNIMHEGVQKKKKPS